MRPAPLVLLALVAEFAAHAEAQSSRPAARPAARVLDADIAAKLPRLLGLMRDGLLQELPGDRLWLNRAAPEGPRTLFLGSYDRHSNMAAYWALLTAARVDGDAAASKTLGSRFTPERLRAERELVARTADVSPVRPYDQTWLLLFLAELERHVEADVALEARAFRLDVERRLIGRAESEPVERGADDESEEIAASLAETRAASSRASRPASRPASGPTSRSSSRSTSRRRQFSAWVTGAYSSAVWPLVVVELAGPLDADTPARLERLRAKQLEQLRPKLAGADPLRGFDFFWTPAIVALFDRTAGLASPYAAPPFEAPPEKITLMNCHRLGCEAAKLWPLAWDAGAGDAAAARLLNERLRLCFAREDAWAGDFLTVTHWVPQFLYFAVWLAQGRP